MGLLQSSLDRLLALTPEFKQSLTPLTYSRTHVTMISSVYQDNAKEKNAASRE